MKNNHSVRSRLLIVEDEAIVAADLQQTLENLGYDVPGVATAGDQAIALAKDLRPDLVLMDINLGHGMDGVAAADRIRDQLDLPVIFLTAHADESTLQRAKISQPFGYLLKPFEERSLHATVEMALYRHQAEKKINRVEKWLSTTLRSVGDAVIAIDMEGRVTFMNLTAEVLTGLTLAEAQERDCDEFFQLKNQQSGELIENPARQAMRAGLVVQLPGEIALRTHHGREINIENSAAPIRDDHGGIIGAVMVMRDSTERVLATRKIQQLNDSLQVKLSEEQKQHELASREMEFLMHAIAHDLRSPLATLRLFTEMLGEKYGRALAGEAHEIVGHINESLTNMDELIRGYMAFVRSDASCVLNLTTVDMGSLAQEVVSEMKGVASLAVLECFISPELPLVVGDEAMLRQVWVNLLSNAVKYRRPDVPLQLRITGEVEAERAIFQLSDNGIGFDDASAQKLFQPFHRLQEKSPVAGVGLGLSLVRRIIEKHGGKISATGTPGKGAVFTFDLPTSL